MKKILLVFLAISLLSIVSCSKNENETNENAQQEPVRQLKPEEIREKIDQSFNANNSFDWNKSSTQLVWSAAQEGQQIISVGYGAPNESFSENRDTKLTSMKDNILKLIAKYEEKEIKEILIHDDDVLNFVDVKISKFKTIDALKQLNNVRYIEPTGYELDDSNCEKSSKGCSKSSEYISSADYGTLYPSGAKIPWNYYTHKIKDAWSYSKGRGITVGVIDTGVSDYQYNMGYRFDDYYSGRYIRKYGVYVDSWKWWATRTDGHHDKCGHGTSACSAIGAPNNSNHSPIGVAYECNIVSYRATKDVVLNRYHERKGVTRALKELARRSDVKIISMSIGYPWSIGNIKDAVRYAYSKHKMIFAAGGTSTAATNWYPVIFPASMSETVAVTGVEERSGYEECDVCHTGRKIDFTYVMERANNHHQPVTGYYNNGANYFGGSSVATASTAGIAALVWARHPSWNREQVFARMKWAAELYPNKSRNFGYGNVNALKAVRGY